MAITPKPIEARLRIIIGSARLVGEKIAGKWKFRCKKWPDLSEFDGTDCAIECIEEFQRRASVKAAGATLFAEKMDP